MSLQRILHFGTELDKYCSPQSIDRKCCSRSLMAMIYVLYHVIMQCKDVGYIKQNYCHMLPKFLICNIMYTYMPNELKIRHSGPFMYEFS